LSEHTLVIVEKNVDPEDREVVDAFVDFLWSDAAQSIFVEYGFRSVNERLNEGNHGFGEIPDAFTIRDLGGWPQAKRDIIDQIWKEQVLPKVGQ
jgi:sulfate transport system substrate-binding protein